MSEKNEIIIYTTPDGKETFEVNLKKDTVWLSQKQMAELFEKDIRTVNEHIGNIYKEKELIKSSTIRKFRIVQKEGNRQVERIRSGYNLDIIISVGYRVKSSRGTQFRIWATNVLKEHLIKGYTINEKRLREDQAKLEEFQKTVSLFLWFLNENGILYHEDGSKRLADNALVALTLLIAESKAEEKDTMVKVIVNLINQNN
ncbi:MAG: virulence RhuM family protein [Candidatus Atribacteria bacterium]|nr:virulence RhuM family protein [Candidatus Atribacteria bacterium]